MSAARELLRGLIRSSVADNFLGRRAGLQRCGSSSRRASICRSSPICLFRIGRIAHSGVHRGWSVRAIGHRFPASPRRLRSCRTGCRTRCRLRLARTIRRRRRRCRTLRLRLRRAALALSREFVRPDCRGCLSHKPARVCRRPAQTQQVKREYCGQGHFRIAVRRRYYRITSSSGPRPPAPDAIPRWLEEVESGTLSPRPPSIQIVPSRSATAGFGRSAPNRCRCLPSLS